MRITIAAAVACLGLVSLSLATDSEAAIRRYELNIPRQALDTALKDLAQQTGLQVARFSDAGNSDAFVGPLRGQYSVGQALDTLLAPSGLTYRPLNERAYIVLTPRELSQRAESLAPAPSPPQPEKSFWDRFRLSQVDQGQTGGGGSTESSGTSSGSDDRIRLEEVVVTAQKRRERLIDTPQSVSVLSSDDLTRLGATQFRDFANSVPGLSFTTNGAGFTQLSLRGVTTGFDIGSTVGLYIDEVPYGSSSGFVNGGQLALDVGLFDLDRIEVLRGPQGTLYGASSMGGLIKYVGREPDATRFGVDAQTGVSDTQEGSISYNGSLVLNAPLVADKAALRASGFYSHDGGYVDNLTLGQKDVNRSGVYGGRLDFLFTPTESLSIRLGGFLQNISRDGQGTADFTFTGPPVDGSLEQQRLFKEPFDQRFRLVSGTVNYGFGPAKLTSVSGYQTMRGSTVFDLSALYVPLFGGAYSAVGYPVAWSVDKFTQEVRLASNQTQALEWLIGAFYTSESSRRLEGFFLRDPAGRPTPNTLFNLSVPTSYRESAAFADLTYHLNAKFDVSAGIRYAQNHQSFTQDGSGPFAPSAPTRRSSEDVSTYLANARYHLNDRATAYVRYATGYRPGGPNFVLNDPATGQPLAPTTFQSDRLKSYEAGIKAESADRNVSVDWDVYYVDWNNIHVASAKSGFGIIVNASSGATVRGTELSIALRPVDGLMVAAAVAYQDPSLRANDPILGAVAGERLPNTAHLTGTLNGDYRLPVDGWRPVIGATVRYVGDRTTSFDQSAGNPQYHLPKYTTIDLRTGFSVSAVDVQLYLHNLFDKRGELSGYTAYSLAGGPAEVSILQPRTVGLSASTHF